jgi:hypothetical protein
MFGASEDRARQLAYRKRRERIASGSSCSVLRSLSSSSHVSQQSQMSSITKQGTSQPPSHAEYTFAYTSRAYNNMSMPDHQTKSQTADCGPGLATDPHRSQMERHRLQAKYLTQVLYDSLSLPTSAREPSNLPGPTTQSDNPGALIQSTTASPLRNATAPVASIEAHSSSAPCVLSHLGLPTLLNTSPTAPNGSFHVHTMTASRGGDRDDLIMEQAMSRLDPVLQPVQDAVLRTQQSHAAKDPKGPLSGSSSTLHDKSLIYDPSRSYMVKFPLATRFCFQPAWTVPITTGTYYDALIRMLPSLGSKVSVDQFLTLFGPMRPATPWASREASARKVGSRWTDTA